MERFDVWHLAGALALGAAIGFCTGVFSQADPPTRDEMRGLEARPRESMAFPGRWYVGPYECADDCSGHLAGFAYARDSGAKSAADCRSEASTSFAEGCWYYLQVAGRLPDEW